MEAAKPPHMSDENSPISLWSAAAPLDVQPPQNVLTTFVPWVVIGKISSIRGESPPDKGELRHNAKRTTYHENVGKHAE